MKDFIINNIFLDVWMYIWNIFVFCFTMAKTHKWRIIFITQYCIYVYAIHPSHRNKIYCQDGSSKHRREQCCEFFHIRLWFLTVCIKDGQWRSQLPMIGRFIHPMDFCSCARIMTVKLWSFYVACHCYSSRQIMRPMLQRFAQHPKGKFLLCRTVLLPRGRLPLQSMLKWKAPMIFEIFEFSVRRSIWQKSCTWTTSVQGQGGL